MLHVLTETAIPPQPLVAASLSLHSATGDARVLVPALPGMQKSMVLQLLSALLDLPPEVLRVALQRLVAPLGGAEASSSGQQAAELSAGEPALFSPVEILTALHTLDYSRDPKLLRKAMQAVTVCLSSPTLFPPETLAAAINALLTRVPLPQVGDDCTVKTCSLCAGFDCTIKTCSLYGGCGQPPFLPCIHCCSCSCAPLSRPWRQRPASANLLLACSASWSASGCGRTGPSGRAG